MVYRTTRFSLALFLPARRSLRPKNGTWASWLIAGANLGWFGVRVKWGRFPNA